jgi:5-formyltetrahydrofolate cyclo-ligase
MTVDQSTLRQRALRARASLGARYIADASQRIVSGLLDDTDFASADIIACYLSLANEVDTAALIARARAQKKRIFAPVVKKDFKLEFRELRADSRLEPNRLGISEPRSGRLIDAARLDIVITPLVAFDNECNRIGMGAGYYDRAFSFVHDKPACDLPVLIGVAFDCQRVEKISVNPWDVRLSRILTETSVFYRPS